MDLKIDTFGQVDIRDVAILEMAYLPFHFFFFDKNEFWNFFFLNVFSY